MLTNEYVALELHRLRVNEFEKNVNTNRRAINEVIAEYKENKRRARKQRRG